MTDSIKLVIDINQVTGWPGQRLNLILRALDEFGNPSGSLTHFSLIRYNNNQLVSISSKNASELCLNTWTKLIDLMKTYNITVYELYIQHDINNIIILVYRICCMGIDNY